MLALFIGNQTDNDSFSQFQAEKSESRAGPL